MGIEVLVNGCKSILLKFGHFIKGKKTYNGSVLPLHRGWSVVVTIFDKIN